MASTVRRGRRAGAMPLLVALVIAIPLLEAIILVRVGHAIGGLTTLGILVAEAALGAWLMKREGIRAWRALQATLVSGRMPAAELTDAALVLVGGILLILPGFLTDVLGFFFLLPLTRPLARSLVGFFAARQVARVGLDVDMMRAASRPGTTIEGEVMPDDPMPLRAGGNPPSTGGTARVLPPDRP